MGNRGSFNSRARALRKSNPSLNNLAAKNMKRSKAAKAASISDS